MSDQADGLRQLVRARRGSAAVAAEAAGPTSLGATRRRFLLGAKGGVGTSNLALNLAVVLATRGRRAVAVEANPDRAHLRLLSGLDPRVRRGGTTSRAPDNGVRLLDMVVEDVGATAVDDLFIDLGSGPHASAVDAIGPDPLILVTTPDPTALADTRALLRRLAGSGLVGVRLVVNQVDGTGEARECLDRLAALCRHGLGLHATVLGHVRHDPRVARAVRTGRPFAIAYPRSAAARDVRRLARRLLREPQLRASPDPWRSEGTARMTPPPK